MANELDHVYFKNHIHRNLRASDDALGEASAHGLSLASNVQIGTASAALKIFKLDSTGNLTTSNNFVLKGIGGSASNLVRIEGSFNVSNDTTLTGSLAIGSSGITTTNATGGYPNITPKVEVKLGLPATGYTGGIVIRSPSSDSSAADRNIVLFFKHSHELSSGESAKFSGFISRTSRSWANQPELGFISAGAERMFLSQNGLRIGYSGDQTTEGASASDDLQVNGSSFLSGVTTINGGGQAQALRLAAMGDQVYMGFYPSGIASRQAYIGFGSTGSKQLIINNEVTTGSLAIFVGGSSRIHITSGGNIGFGTGSPRGDLELAGSENKTLRIGGIFRGTGTYTGLNEETTRHQIVFSGWRDVQTDTIGAKIVAINKTAYGISPNWDLVQHTDLAFFTLGAQASSTDSTVERMRLLSDGRLGLNTSTPASGLDVNANAVFRSGVTISGSLGVDGLTNINNRLFVSTTNDQIAVFRSSGTTTGGVQFYYYKSDNGNAYLQDKTMLYLGGVQTGGLIYDVDNGAASHFWHVGGYVNTSTQRMRLSSNGLRINLASDLTTNGAAASDELQVGGNTYISGNLAVKAEGGLLKLVGTTHSYIELYPTGTSGFPNGRSGYIGFSNPANKHLNIVNSETTGSIILQTSGTNRFSINSSGTVLIGDAFDVGSSFWAAGTAQTIIGGTPNTGFNTGTGTKLLITGYNNQDVSGESDIYPLYLQDENANTLALADFWVRAKQVVSPARNSVTYIGGDLGINTTTPAVRLDVKGDTVLQSGVTISGNTFLAMQTAAKVGINTTSPASGLDVNDNAVFRSGVTISGLTSLNTITTTGDLTVGGKLTFTEYNHYTPSLSTVKGYWSNTAAGPVAVTGITTTGWHKIASITCPTSGTWRGANFKGSILRYNTNWGENIPTELFFSGKIIFYSSGPLQDTGVFYLTEGFNDNLLRLVKVADASWELQLGAYTTNVAIAWEVEPLYLGSQVTFTHFDRAAASPPVSIATTTTQYHSRVGDTLGRSLDLSSTLVVDGRTDINNQFFVTTTSDQLAGFTGSGTASTGSLNLYYYRRNNATDYIQDKTMLYVNSFQTGGLIYSVANASASHLWHVGGFNSTSSERMRLSSNGLRINLASDLTTNGAAASDELQVGGNTYLNGNLSVKSNGGLLNLVGTDHSYIGFYPTGTSGFPNERSGFIGFAATSNKDIYVNNTVSTGSLRFRTIDIDRLIIDPSGRVGINTTSPASGLDVNANSVFRSGVTISGSLSVTGASTLRGNANFLGNVVVGTGTSSFDLDVDGLSRSKSYISSQTVGSAGSTNLWFELGYSTLTAAYADETVCLLVSNRGGSNSNDTAGMAQVIFRAKQPNVMSGFSPVVDLLVPWSAGVINSQDFVAVVTQDDASAKVIKLMARLAPNYDELRYTIFNQTIVNNTNEFTLNYLPTGSATLITGVTSYTGIGGFYTSSTGAVGIGTVSPASGLDVAVSSVFRSGVTISGALSLNTITTTGTINANSLNVSGNTSVTGTLGVTGNVNVENGYLYVKNGITYLWGGLVTNAPSTLQGDLDVRANLSVRGSSILPAISSYEIDTDNLTYWYKIGNLSGDGANVTVISTALDGYSFTTQAGNIKAVLKADNAGNLGGIQHVEGHSQSTPPVSSFGFRNISTRNWDIYYKAAPYTRGSIIVLDGFGFTPTSSPRVSTDPGVTELTRSFIIVNDAVFRSGVTISGNINSSIPTEIGETNRNLLLQSQDFSKSNWVRLNISASGTPVSSPDFHPTSASQITGNNALGGHIHQQIATTVGQTYVCSVFLKGTTPGSTTINITNFDGLFSIISTTTCNYTTNWQRFSVTGTATSTGTRFYIGGLGDWTNGEVISLWGAQFESGSTPTRYISTSTISTVSTGTIVTDPVLKKTYFDGTVEIRNDGESLRLVGNNTHTYMTFYATGTSASGRTGYLGFTNVDNLNQFIIATPNAAAIMTGTNGWVFSSDASLKKDIELTNYGLETIKNLSPKSFRMANDSPDSAKLLGFIAQEVKDVLPEAVGEINSNDKKHLGISYNTFIPVIVKSIQDLSDKIKQLEESLKSKGII